MSDMIYFYAAYSIIWIGIFLYIFKLHLSPRKLKKDIEILKEVMNERENKKNL